MELLDWFGRFHPAFVHFPIGILVVGIIMQFIAHRKPTLNLNTAISTLYLIGFITAVIAAFAGWLLAKEGGYQPDTIFWHRWLGVLMVVFAFGLYWYARRDDINHKSMRWAGLVVFLGLLYTGHLGGEMTHGEDYLLESAPDFVKKLVSYEEGADYAILSDPDSVRIYDDLIKPVFETKCFTCHDQNLHKGGLDMSSEEMLLEGGRNGSIIEGTAEESELFKRVTMDPSSRKYMPPKGNPLSYQEVKLLEWWIETGATFEKRVTEVEVPENIQGILMARHELDTKPKTFLEKTKVEAVPEDIMADIAAKGFSIKPLAMNTNFVDVQWKDVDSLSINEATTVLEKAATQIAWLDMGNAGLDDAAMAPIGSLENLVRLKVDNNPVTDAGIKHLADLKHLESLNLYSTKITDISADYLSGIKSLRKLFVWQTEFSSEAAESLQASVPELEVVQGYTFAEPTQ